MFCLCDFYTGFFIFICGCVLGVVTETLWCLFKNGRLESRKGLVYGPFNLVYGFGSLWMTLIYMPFREIPAVVLFVIGALTGSFWEYICSFLQEKLFGSVSWDYSELTANLHGRISLKYSLFWGILSVLWIKALLPGLCRVFAFLPERTVRPVSFILLVFIVFDSLISAAVVLRMKNRHKGRSALNALERFLDMRFPDERVRKIYPNMVFKVDGEKVSVDRDHECVGNFK